MIIRLGSGHAREIAKIHINALKNDFLPSLGENFLTILYQNLLDNPAVFGFSEKSSNKLVGFIIGTENMEIFFKQALRKNTLRLGMYLMLRIIKNSNLIKKVVETLLYTSKDKGPKAELVVIAVLKKYQGVGLGRKLVKTLEKEFINKGIQEYKLTVHSDKTAVNFYQKLKYKKYGSFILYGKNWLIFTKKIK